MTKAKPKIIHVVVSPELHKRLSDAGRTGIETLKFEMSMSDVVRWVLGVGLNTIEAKRDA